ncbi:MAG: glycosyltransferase family 4 protein [Phycisphaerae bacterium]
MTVSHRRRRRVCVFTLHSVKDNRVFDRQILTLVRHGYRVTLFGGGEGQPYEFKGVTIHPVPKTFGTLRQRLAAIARLTWRALRTDADIYHFHDPDLLPSGVLVRLVKRRPVVYDAHELYRVKFKVKALRRPLLQRLITSVYGVVEDALVRLIGNVSAVYEEYTSHFRRLGCEVVLTPNYASRRDYSGREPTDEEWEQRRNKLIYVGRVNPLRGAHVMIAAMRKVREQCPAAELIVTRRFSYRSHERRVMQQLAQPGYEGLVRLIPDTPGDELAAVVRWAMIGLSPLQDVGQYRIAVPSKFFDYMAES